MQDKEKAAKDAMDEEAKKKEAEAEKEDTDDDEDEEVRSRTRPLPKRARHTHAPPLLVRRMRRRRTSCEPKTACLKGRPRRSHNSQMRHCGGSSRIERSIDRVVEFRTAAH